MAKELPSYHPGTEHDWHGFEEVDASEDYTVRPRRADIDSAAPMDALGCGIADAACARDPRLAFACITKSRARLGFRVGNGRIRVYRYELPGRTRNAIMAFDFSGGKMKVQTYTFRAMRLSETLAGKREKNARLGRTRETSKPGKGRRDALHWARGFDPSYLDKFRVS